MDTLFILRDSVPVDVVKIIGSCQPCIQEAKTSWQDVAIAFCICVTLIIIVTFVICRLITSREEERKWQHEDIERKRQDNFLNKYLEFLKGQTQEGEDEVKSIQYRLALEYIIELTQKGELNTMSKENLESFFNTQMEKYNSQ